MPAAPRPEIADIPAVPHGAVPLAELRLRGLPEGPVLDFSASLSPLGPPAGVAEAVAAVDPARYPDPGARPLCELLALQLGVPAAHLVAGNGASELLWLTALAFLRPGDRAFVLGPTYGEYARACRAVGNEVLGFTARKKDLFAVDLVALVRVLERDRPRLLFLCNPNNPTGLLLTRQQIQVLGGAFDGLTVVDEAYLPFVHEPEELLDLAVEGRLLLLRSMTKSFALAGLRLGYAAGSEQAIAALRKIQPPWSVNAAAIAAGCAALEDKEYPARVRAAVDEAKGYLQAELGELGFAVVPTAANFLLVSVGDAATMTQKLLERGIIVRDCSSFNLPDYIRIGIRRLEDCQALVSSLRSLLPSPEPWRDPLL